MTLRVLVVDDCEFWRLYVSSALENNADYHVIGHAADGLEALQAAAHLKPDLIVLDVGLPTLSGIEAARRILSLAPDAKILFFSEHRSSDIADAALGTGARGYVVKSDADSDLLPAIDAIVEGRQFVSASLAGISARAAEPAHHRTRCHEVDFCADEASLLDGFFRFAEAALSAGNAAIVIATSARRHTLRQRLRACGLDIDAATEEGRYVSLDVAVTLAQFMVKDSLHEARFWEVATPIVAAAARASKGEPPRVAAWGECAPSLLRDGHAAAAVRLEQLWDELARTYDVDIRCGYALHELHGEANETLRQIRAEHSAVRSDHRASGESAS